MVSLIYWLLGIGSGIAAGDNMPVVYLNVASFIITGMLLVGLWMKINLDWLIGFYCFAWLSLFILFWKYNGGMDGSYSYAYFSILVIFLGLLKTRLRLFMVFMLCLINIVLTLDVNSEILVSVSHSDYSTKSLAFDYFFHSLVVAAVVVFIKVSFDREREKIETHNVNLDRINKELSMKNEQLTNQRHQIKRIQNNLEELVHEHTLELENKNQALQEYAYDNAHIVRRPLSNILSLLDILNNSDVTEENNSREQLKMIRKNASELDEVVLKINTILK